MIGAPRHRRLAEASRLWREWSVDLRHDADALLLGFVLGALSALAVWVMLT